MGMGMGIGIGMGMGIVSLDGSMQEQGRGRERETGTGTGVSNCRRNVSARALCSLITMRFFPLFRFAAIFICSLILIYLIS